MISKTLEMLGLQDTDVGVERYALDGNHVTKLGRPPHSAKWVVGVGRDAGNAADILEVARVVLRVEDSII